MSAGFYDHSIVMSQLFKNITGVRVRFRIWPKMKKIIQMLTQKEKPHWETEKHNKTRNYQKILYLTNTNGNT